MLVKLPIPVVPLRRSKEIMIFRNICLLNLLDAGKSSQRRDELQRLTGDTVFLVFTSHDMLIGYLAKSSGSAHMIAYVSSHNE